MAGPGPAGVDHLTGGRVPHLHGPDRVGRRQPATVPSSPAEARRLPSGLKTTPATAPRWPSMVRISGPVAATRAFANAASPGEGEPRARRGWGGRPVASQTRTVPSGPAEAREAL